MRYRILYTADFEKAAKRYGRVIRKRLDEALGLLEEDPFHPQLHTKPLTGPLKGYYSFRLGRDYRVIFVFRGESTIHLLRIAKRDEIYR